MIEQSILLHVQQSIYYTSSCGQSICNLNLILYPINPWLTLAHDDELEHLTQRVIIPQGGVKPYVHPALSTRTYKPVSGSGSEKGSQLIHQELRIPLHKGKKNFCFELLMEVQ